METIPWKQLHSQSDSIHVVDQLRVADLVLLNPIAAFDINHITPFTVLERRFCIFESALTWLLS